NSTLGSYNSTSQSKAQGDVFTNGTLKTSNYAYINGNATAGKFVVSDHSGIRGNRKTLTQPEAFLQVKIPDLLPDLGAINLSSSQTQHLAVGSYLVSNLTLSKSSTLYVDNCTGPVTIYATGSITITDSAKVVTCSTNPEEFAVYVSGTGQVSVGGTNGGFYGVLYAPTSTINLSSSGDIFGAVVAGSLKLSSYSKLHYDAALRDPRVSSLVSSPVKTTTMMAASASTISDAVSVSTISDAAGASMSSPAAPVNADAMYEVPEL